MAVPFEKMGYLARLKKLAEEANNTTILNLVGALELAQEALGFYAGNSKGPYAQQSPSEVWYGHDSGDKARSTLAAISKLTNPIETMEER